MDRNVEMLLGIVAILVPAVVAIAVYRWRQRQRACHIAKEVKAFLLTRYGELPTNLNINCSDDRLWPVLVTFDRPGTDIRLLLQFAFPGHMSPASLLSEAEQPRSTACSAGLSSKEGLPSKNEAPQGRTNAEDSNSDLGRLPNNHPKQGHARVT